MNKFILNKKRNKQYLKNKILYLEPYLNFILKIKV